MKINGINIPGIGHRIKSKQNPDLRVTSLIEYAKAHFPSTPCLDFALEVEEITTSKKENLILNCNFAIKKPGFWMIVGKNGSGKSTLLKLIS